MSWQGREKERGGVILDQPPRVPNRRRLRSSRGLRLVFDTAALRSQNVRRQLGQFRTLAQLPLDA